MASVPRTFARNSRLQSASLLVLAAWATACIPQKMSASFSPGIAGGLKKIAIAPSGGLLADAIGAKLLRYGFEIYDTQQVSNLMLRLNLSEVELYEPQNLSRLQSESIDAVLYVRSVGGYDGRPDSATVKLTSTADGRLIAGASWENRRAGARGSPAEGFARVGLEHAAEKITETLAKGLMPLKER